MQVEVHLQIKLIENKGLLCSDPLSWTIVKRTNSAIIAYIKYYNYANKKPTCN